MCRFERNGKVLLGLFDGDGPSDGVGVELRMATRVNQEISRWAYSKPLTFVFHQKWLLNSLK